MDPIRGFSLAAVVLFSLILPLAASVWIEGGDGRTISFRAVWIGQWLGAVGGLWIIVAPVRPEFGVIVSAVVCLTFLPIVRRRMRPSAA